MLERTCPGCKGRNKVMAQAWLDWKLIHERDPPQGHSLHRVPKVIDCGRCSGRGVVLTRFGRVVLRRGQVQIQRFFEFWRREGLA